jgi:hypothetical protein
VGKLEAYVIRSRACAARPDPESTNALPRHPAEALTGERIARGAAESSCNIRWPASLPAVATLNTPRCALGASATWERYTALSSTRLCGGPGRSGRLRNGLAQSHVRRTEVVCGICVMRRDTAEVSRLPDVVGAAEFLVREQPQPYRLVRVWLFLDLAAVRLRPRPVAARLAFPRGSGRTCRATSVRVDSTQAFRLMP